MRAVEKARREFLMTGDESPDELIDDARRGLEEVCVWGHHLRIAETLPELMKEATALSLPAFRVTVIVEQIEMNWTIWGRDDHGNWNQMQGPFTSRQEADDMLASLRDGSFYAPMNGGVGTPNTQPLEIREL